MEAGRCAKELNLPQLAGARPVRPKNAVYLSRVTSVWFYGADRHEQLYAQAIHGICKAAYLRGIPFGFVHQDNLNTAFQEGVRTLFLPMPMTLSGWEVDQLEEFIRAGGTVVTEAFPGLYDHTGLLDQSASAMERLFGLRHVEVQGLGEHEKAAALREGECCFCGALYRQAAMPLPDTKTLASYPDGLPAWTEHAMGLGKGVWFGSFVSLPFALGDEKGNETPLSCYFSKEGYEAFAALDVPGGEGFCPAFSTVVRLLETDAQYLIVAVNSTSKEAPVRIKLKDTKGQDHDLQLCVPPGQGLIKPFPKQDII